MALGGDDEISISRRGKSRGNRYSQCRKGRIEKILEFLSNVKTEKGLI